MTSRVKVMTFDLWVQGHYIGAKVKVTTLKSGVKVTTLTSGVKIVTSRAKVMTFDLDLWVQGRDL